MANRSKAFLSNTIWSLVLQIVAIIVGFLVPRTIVGVYGSEINGLVSSLTQLVSYITLVEAGISSAAIFALYKPLSEDDIEEISVIVSVSKRFYYKSGALFVTLVALLAFLYPLCVDVGALSRLQVALIVVALGASGFLDFFTLAKYRVLLTASQRNWVIQIASIIYKVAYAAVVLSLAFMHVAIEMVYVAAVFPIVLRTFILVVYANRTFPEVDYSAEDNGFKLEQRWDAFFLQILGMVQAGAPIIIASFMLNDLAEVSVLSMYLMIANAAQSVCLSLSSGTQASFGDVIAKNENEVLQRTFKEFQTISYSMNALVSSVALVLIIPFMALYMKGVSDVNYVVPTLGFFVIANVFLYHLKTPQGLLVVSAGMYKVTRIQTSVQTIVLILAACALGYYFGIVGVMVGACLSNLYRDIDLAIFIPRKLTKTPVSDTARRIFLCLVKFALAVAPFGFINVTCDSWLVILLLAVMSCMWSVLVVAAVTYLFEREQFVGLAYRLKRILHIG